jgi:hypothetical protein
MNEIRWNGKIRVIGVVYIVAKRIAERRKRIKQADSDR